MFTSILRRRFFKNIILQLTLFNTFFNINDLFIYYKYFFVKNLLHKVMILKKKIFLNFSSISHFLHISSYFFFITL